MEDFNIKEEQVTLQQKKTQELTLKEKAAKGVFWGGLSNILQQILHLIFGIVLGRILSAEDYGLIGMLTVFIAIAGIVHDGGFVAALTNKKDVKHEDYNAVFWFSTLSSFLMYVLLFFLSPFISSYFNEPRLLPLSRVLFLSFIISGIGTVPSAFLFKNLMIKERATSEIISLVCSGSIGILMALNGFSYWGLATQTIIYIFVGTCIRWYYAKWIPQFKINLTPLKEMFGFSLNLFFTSIFFQITNNIYSIILGKYYNASQVGYYAQGNKWQLMGSSVITGIFAYLAQPLFIEAEANNSDPVKVFRKLLRFASFLSFPIMLGLAFIGEEFIIITVGVKWLPCVSIMQILCIWGAFSPIWRLYNELLISKGRSNYYLRINVIVGLLQILLALIMYPYGIYKMLIVYLFVNFLGLLICHYFVNKVIRIRFFEVLKDILPYLLITIGVLGVSFLLTVCIENLYLRFGLKFIVPIILYSSMMLITKSVMFNESIYFIKQQIFKYRK